MEIVRAFGFICISVLYPLFLGGLFLVVCKGKGQGNFAKAYLHGGLVAGAVFAALSFVGVRFGISFSKLSLLTLLLGGMLLGACVVILILWKKYRDYMRGLLPKKEQIKSPANLVLVAVFFSVALLYVIRPFPIEPSFVTPEQVVTVLDSGKLSGVDMFSGEEVEISGNWKDQISNLPLFYACLCRIFGISETMLLFGAVPYCVLFAAFCMVWVFAEGMGADRKRKIIAVAVFAVVTMCGDCAYMNTSYGLLHFPYEPMTILSCIVLPLIPAFAMTKEHVLSYFLLLVNAVFLAGVYKGLAMSAVAFLAVATGWIVCSCVKRRAKEWT